MSITPLPWAPTPRTSRSRSRNSQALPTAAETPTRKAPRKAKVVTLEVPAAGASTESPDLQRRNDLILEYLPLVKFIANRIAGRLPNHVEVDDLIESGIIGLIDALEKFDPSHQIKFKTYAEFRIRGAILDELRALDWVPRSTRQKATRLEKAYAELEQRLGRSASDSEIMKFLGIGQAEFDDLIREARGTALISLDELRGEGDDGSEHSLIEYLANPDETELADNISMDQAYRRVAETIDLLPEKERLVIALYYYEELTMREIGEIMSVTESRVSQIHTKAILRLRGRMMKALEKEK